MYGTLLFLITNFCVVISDANYDKNFLIGMSDGNIKVYSWDFSTYETPMMAEIPASNYRLTLDYHYAKRLIFICLNGFMFKSTFDPQRNKVATVTNARKVISDKVYPGFAVDWVHDRIYWADYQSGHIKVCGLNGEAQETVLSRPDSFVQRMEIDPYKGILFWTTGAVIQSVNKSGDGFNRKVTRGDVRWSSLALDLRLERVYYVEDKDGSLYSMDYAGGEKMKHFSVPQSEDVRGLSILGDKVIWNHYNSSGWEEIYEAPLNLTRMEDAKMLKILNSNVTHMRVMHPFLQSQLKIEAFPCLKMSCVHTCVANGTTTAKCECPSGQILNHDGVSCQNIPDYKTQPQTTESVATELPSTVFTDDLTSSTEHSSTQIPTVIPKEESISRILYIVYCIFFLNLVVLIPLLVYLTVWLRTTNRGYSRQMVYFPQSEQVELT